MKRTLILLLALVMLMIPLLTACKKDKNEGNEGTPTTPPAAETLPGPKSKVPEGLKFTGQDINIMLPQYAVEEFAIEEESTAVIDEAIKKRNDAVEARLDIVLNYLPRSEANTGAYQAVIRSNILSDDGGDGCDIFVGNAYYTAALAAEGLFYDFNTVDDKNYISTDFEWYNQSFVNNTAYKKQLYFLTGDLTISIYDRTPVVFFNEEEVKKWEITDNLYQTALDGNWTMAYLQGLVKNIHQNLDDDENETAGDYYGMFFNGGSMAIDATLTAAGIHLTSTDADGNISVSWGAGNATDAFAKIYELMYESKGIYTGLTKTGTYYGELTSYYSEQAFFEKRAVFAHGMISAAKTFAMDTELHFGMLPLPKFDAKQAYATSPQDGHSIIAISRSLAGDRLARATAVLETLSQQSYLILRPVYHDTAYKVRYASSEETAKLFDTVINSVTFDFGMLYSNYMQNATHKLRNRLSGDGGNKASGSLSGVTMMYTKQVEGYLTELLTKFDNLGTAVE